MTQLALNPAYRAVEVHEFLDMNFGGAKAELVDGMIWMMASGSPRHAALATNIIIALGTRLRGAGCRPYGSDLAVRTGEQTVRFPDVTVYCRPLTEEDRNQKLIGDPRVVFEVLSPSTSMLDQGAKLEEYRSLPGVEAVVFIDPDRELVRVVEKTGADSWTNTWLEQGSDLVLRLLDVAVPHGEMFEE